MDKNDGEPATKKRKDVNGKESIPTREELTNLRENETLFKSSLYRLQIDELLKEVKISEKRKIKIQKWFEKFKNEVTKFPICKSEQYQKKDGNVLPILKNSKNGVKKDPFMFHPPNDIKLVGGFPLGLGIKSTNVVDVMIRIPKLSLRKDDLINFRYHYKRALYLSYLANNLQKSELVEFLEYEYDHGNETKPVLIVTPKGKLNKKAKVRILLSPPMDHFKFTKLGPQRNNIRSGWFYNEELKFDDEAPTPRYNNSILSDVFIQSSNEYLFNILSHNRGICDGILLLKVWLHQRDLDSGYGAISNFVLTMFVAHLLEIKKLHPLMSSYQIARNTWVMLTQCDWTNNCNNLQNNFQDFSSHFPVVFMDPTGSFNLCADVEETTFLRLQNEAQLAINVIDVGDNFDVLFMTPVPFERKFDHIIQIDTGAAELNNAIEKFDLKTQLTDYVGNTTLTLLPVIINILKRGLGKRIDFICIKPQKNCKWKIDESPREIDRKIKIGLLLNQEHHASILDKGPSADCSEAKEFREFWGEKSELRRFPDTSICEAVTWPCSSLSEKRLVSSHVVSYLLKHHFNINKSEVDYIGGQLDKLISLNLEEWPSNWPPYGTGDEVMMKCNGVLDQLRRQLTKLDDLPLTITSVQGISPVFRFTEVFPPLPFPGYSEMFEERTKNNCLLPSVKCDQFVQHLDVLISMEGSNKWPNNAEAVKRIKAAFYLKLASLMKEQYQLICSASQNFVYIFKDGFVFRLQIAYRREATLLKRERSEDGVLKFKENEKSVELEREIIHLPKLTTTLHGLQLQNGAFSSACRLAKRWVSSQLLLDYIPELAIDLMMAKVFISPEPFTTPRCAQVAFQRWLFIVATHNYKTTPFIVNLNNELKEEAITDLISEFTSNRAHLPPLYMATPFDLKSSWTKNAPNLLILNRLVELAKGAVSVLEKQLEEPKSNDLKTIFRPSFDPYDVVIHLKINKLPLREYFVDDENDLSYKENVSDIKFMPVMNYDPVECYLKELRNCFDQFAAFFYDKFGGRTIGVLWKIQQFQPTSFKIDKVNCCKLNDDGKLIPNLEAIIEDFQILGQGLVKSVHTNADKWKIS